MIALTGYGHYVLKYECLRTILAAHRNMFERVSKTRMYRHRIASECCCLDDDLFIQPLGKSNLAQFLVELNAISGLPSASRNHDTKNMIPPRDLYEASSGDWHNRNLCAVGGRYCAIHCLHVLEFHERPIP